MAPEQLKGAAASVRTDLYSLGLVLYELFSGKCAFGSRSPMEAARHADVLRPAPLSDLPLGVEQVIFQCLEPNPDKRPHSVMHVAAALPESDSANLVPDDLMVENTADMRPRVAWSVFTVTLSGLAVLLVLAPRITGLSMELFKVGPSPLAVVFVWSWCIALQSLFVFLSIAYMLRMKMKMR